MLRVRQKESMNHQDGTDNVLTFAAETSNHNDF
jgi:hypothetical protein